MLTLTLAGVGFILIAGLFVINKKNDFELL